MCFDFLFAVLRVWCTSWNEQGIIQFLKERRIEWHLVDIILPITRTSIRKLFLALRIVKRSYRSGRSSSVVQRIFETHIHLIRLSLRKWLNTCSLHDEHRMQRKMQRIIGANLKHIRSENVLRCVLQIYGRLLRCAGLRVIAQNSAWSWFQSLGNTPIESSLDVFSHILLSSTNSRQR